MNKLNKGITLIALVITIIVLIILAGISLNIIFGNGGLVEKTKQGSEAYKDAATKEKIQISAITASTNNNGKFDKNVFKQELDKSFGRNGYTMTEDDETGEITVTVDDKKYIVSADGNFLDNSAKSYDSAKDASLGTDTSNATWDPNKQATGQAKLDLGETVNLRLKKLSAIAQGVSEEELDNMTVYNSEDNYITAIEWYNGHESGRKYMNYGQLAMTADSVLGEDAEDTSSQLIVSDVPIWAWVEGTKIYIWSPNNEIIMHPHSERMFQGFKNLRAIGALPHFKSDNVETMRYMFNGSVGWFDSGTFLAIANWDISNVKTSIKAGQENVPSNNGFYKMCPGVQYYGSPNVYITPPDFSERPGVWDYEGSYWADSKKYYAYKMGEEVTVGGENFYVIEDTPSTQNTVKLIAKYPLKKDGSAQAEVDPQTNQLEDTKAPFSSSNYWTNEWHKYYVEEHPNFDRQTTPYLDISSLEGYVEGDAMYKAKKYVESKGGTNGRLLTWEELAALTPIGYNGGPIKNSYFWVASATNSENRVLYRDGYTAVYNDGNQCSVRPIMTATRDIITFVN